MSILTYGNSLQQFKTASIALDNAGLSTAGITFNISYSKLGTKYVILTISPFSGATTIAAAGTINVFESDVTTTPLPAEIIPTVNSVSSTAAIGNNSIPVQITIDGTGKFLFNIASNDGGATLLAYNAGADVTNYNNITFMYSL